MDVEESYLTDRGRMRRRKVNVDLDEVRRGLGLPTTDDRADWERIRGLLAEAVGESRFEIWLAPLELVAVDRAGKLVIGAPPETAAWVWDRFGRMLSTSLSVWGVSFGSRPSPSEQRSSATADV